VMDLLKRWWVCLICLLTNIAIFLEIQVIYDCHHLRTSLFHEIPKGNPHIKINLLRYPSRQHRQYGW
jgi:hypothetical protein